MASHRPDDSRPSHGVFHAGTDESAIRAHLEKLLYSRIFAGSARMCRFLHFVVEHTLAGRADELKEYLLGTEIFDRDASFDPRVDPIVRVEARRLRSKLKAYYEAEGQSDPLSIDLPVGSYVPRFGPRATGAHPGIAAASTCIAVLPFANLSPEPDSEYFSDGLTEELIHALTKVEGVSVVAWNSSARLKDRQHDFVAAGRELKAGSILSGSVRQAAGRLRVMARLVDTSSGQYLWSETYDRKIEDVFAIQEEISTAIARSLRTRLLGPAALPPRRGAKDLRAYDLYLRGRFHWNKRTPEGLHRAIALFEQAIAADPEFAFAHAGLADAYSLRADYGLALSGDVMPAAKAAALRALELDPTLAEPHASIALICSLYEWKWKEAGEHYRRAIELNPNYVTAHHWYGVDHLALLGRFDEALAEIEGAIRLDPLSCILREGAGYTLMLARRYDEALENHLDGIDLDSNFYKFYTGMGRIYLQKAMYPQALELLEKGRSLAGGDIPNLLGAMGQASALAGKTAEARGLLARLSEMAQHRYVPSTSFALIHCGLGETERALEWLEFARERREPSLCAIKVHPAYDTLRGEPRFAALLREIGFDH